MGDIFGKRLSEAQAAAGFPSGRQLALASGVGQPEISTYLAGKELPGPGNMLKLASALGLPQVELEAWVLEERVSTLPTHQRMALMGRLRASEDDHG